MDMETQIRQALARGYCSKENEQKVLDPDLIEAMTRELLESFTPARTDCSTVFTPCWCGGCHTSDYHLQNINLGV